GHGPAPGAGAVVPWAGAAGDAVAGACGLAGAPVRGTPGWMGSAPDCSSGGGAMSRPPATGRPGRRTSTYVAPRLVPSARFAAAAVHFAGRCAVVPRITSGPSRT